MKLEEMLQTWMKLEEMQQMRMEPKEMQQTRMEPGEMLREHHIRRTCIIRYIIILKVACCVKHLNF